MIHHRLKSSPVEPVHDLDDLLGGSDRPLESQDGVETDRTHIGGDPSLVVELFQIEEELQIVPEVSGCGNEVPIPLPVVIVDVDVIGYFLGLGQANRLGYRLAA